MSILLPSSQPGHPVSHGLAEAAAFLPKLPFWFCYVQITNLSVHHSQNIPCTAVCSCLYCCLESRYDSQMLDFPEGWHKTQAIDSRYAIFPLTSLQVCSPCLISPGLALPEMCLSPFCPIWGMMVLHDVTYQELC